MRSLMFAASLVSALALNAETTAYVVPFGTAGNTPTEPYATWETAATNILTAATAAGADGLVKIASGDYSANTPRLANQHVPVAFEAVDATTDAAGEAIIGNNLLSYSGLCPAAGKNQITLQKGVFRMSYTTAHAYYTLEEQSGYASNTVIVTGADTKLSALGTKQFYYGYAKGSCLKFTDHAIGEFDSIVAPNSAAGLGATLIVENGACVTNGITAGAAKQGYFGYSGAEAHIIVSNGTLRLNGQTLLGASTRKGTTVYVGGENPVLSGGGDLKFLGDTVTTMDMAEAPLGGYATVPIYAVRLYYRPDCRFHVIGLDKLQERLLAAGIRSGTWTILDGQSVETSDATVDSLAAEVERLTAAVPAANPNFTFTRTGTTTCKFIITFKYLGSDNTYVVPEGTASVTPIPPFNTWATASTNISLAGDFVKKSGTVTLLEGSYNEARYTKDYPIYYKIVKDMSENPAPGTATGLATIMGYKGQAWQEGMDRTAYFTSGTLKLTTTTGIVFFSHDGEWSNDRKPHFVATGSDTVIDASGKTMYWGYTSHNTTIEILNGAQVLAYGSQVCPYEGIKGTKVTIGSGAVCRNTAGFGIGVECTAAQFTIDNGTVASGTVVVDNNTKNRGTKLQFKGANPLMSVSDNIQINGNTEITFNLAEAALTGYKAINATKVHSFSDNATIVIDGLDALKARMAEAKCASAQFTLVASTQALPTTLTTKLSAIELPDDCEIVYKNNSAILKVGRAGFSITVQ